MRMMCSLGITVRRHRDEANHIIEVHGHRKSSNLDGLCCLGISLAAPPQKGHRKRGHLLVDDPNAGNTGDLALVIVWAVICEAFQRCQSMTSTSTTFATEAVSCSDTGTPSASSLITFGTSDSTTVDEAPATPQPWMGFSVRLIKSAVLV